MRIILCALNARYSHTNLALCCLKSYCASQDDEFILKEFSINQHASFMVQDILTALPDAVAFSAYIWNIPQVIETARLLKDCCPSIVIIAGGPEVSHNKLAAAEKSFDYVITGKGEKTFRSLIRGRFSSPQRILLGEDISLADVPFPYSDAELTGMKGKLLYYESSRGCQHACSFCLSALSSPRVEYRPLEMVYSELSRILQHYSGTVKIIDRTFNSRKSHYMPIWKFLIDNYRPRITFHFEIYPERLTQDDFDILRTVPPGYFQFECGIQSIDSKVLHAVGRRQDFSAIQKSIACLIDMGTIHIHTDQIAGLPCETPESMKNSFNAIYMLRADHFQPGILKVIPGTPLSKDVARLEIQHSPEPPYRVVSTPLLSAGNIDVFVKISEAVEIIYNSGKYRTAVHELEKLFSCAYSLYREIISDANWNMYTDKRFDMVYNTILSVIEKKFAAEKIFFRDILMYDYALYGNTHRLPLCLLGDYVHSARKDSLSLIQSLSKNKTIEIKGALYRLSDIKRCIFMRFTSDRCRKMLKTADDILAITAEKKQFRINIQSKLMY